MPVLPINSHKTSLRQSPQAILFDCDGTLVLTADLHFRAIAGVIESHGKQMPKDWYMARSGLGRRDLLTQFALDFACSLDISQIVDESIARTLTLAAEVVENSSVAAVARQAFGRLPIAVVTNSEAAIANSFLSQAGLRHLFNCLLTCEDAARLKPDPTLYLLAATRLGVDPKGCLVLEDSDQGIQAAKAAGMMSFDVRHPEWEQNQVALLEGFTLEMSR